MVEDLAAENAGDGSIQASRARCQVVGNAQFGD